MPQLTLVGVSDDRTRLLLVDDAGDEFTLALDGRLRAALRGETSRLGQLEITMESTLRPRDIQARIRAGESPEAVAEAAQTTVDKIMAFAGPVMAERQHVADRAQKSSLRRGGESSGGARTLGEAVAAHLRTQQVDPSSVEWDAWRREDGRWTLTGTYRTTRREGVASFTFDAPGSYVTLDDDDARWLVGEQVTAAAAASPATTGPRNPGDDLSAARARRRATGPVEDELPLGDDAIELVSGPAPAMPVLGDDDDTATTPAVPADDSPVPTTGADADEVPLAEPAARVEAPAATLPPAPSETAAADGPAAGGPAAGDQAADQTADQGGEPDEEDPPRRPVTKKRGRASVPSWDEIMFGGRDQ